MKPKIKATKQLGTVAESRQSFGGSWTELKLNLVESYLQAYSTALKKRGSIRCTWMLLRAPATER